MKLTLQSPYLSIDQLAPIDLPDFVVLTGKNGSGKSQLIAAIRTGRVIVDDGKITKIQSYNIDSFRVREDSQITLNEVSSFTNSAWSFFSNEQQSRVRERLSALEKRHTSLLEPIFGYCTTKQVPIYDFSPSMLPDLTVEQTSAFSMYMKDSEAVLREAQRSNAEIGASLLRLFRLTRTPMAQLDETRFKRLIIPATSIDGNSVESFTRVFLDYFRKGAENNYKKWQNDVQGRDFEVLSDEEFEQAHGEPPWKTVNRLLARFTSVPIEITYPEDTSLDARFVAKIRHRDRNGLECKVEDLSSGERVMLAIASTLLRSRLDNGGVDLLLLDEIDATLHPSIIKDLLATLDDFQRNFACKVIMVTHSPSTVALAPSGSVYVMHRSGENRIERIENEAALSILTDGFATLTRGVALLDFVMSEGITIISEGKNVDYIEMALEHYGLKHVKVLRGLESMTGKNQLATLFDFFGRVIKGRYVVFVWDCDVSPPQKFSDWCIPFSFGKNTENTLCSKGIENLFDDDLFEQEVLVRVEKGGRFHSVNFDPNAKTTFLNHVRMRNNKADFLRFRPLIDVISAIKPA